MFATLYTSIIYRKYKDSGIQTTVKPNELLSLMTVRRYCFYSSVMTYILPFGESTIHNFCGVEFLGKQYFHD